LGALLSEKNFAKWFADVAIVVFLVLVVGDWKKAHIHSAYVDFMNEIELFERFLKR
jgi:hypothetical protein